MQITRSVGTQAKANTWIIVNTDYSDNKCVLIDANDKVLECLSENKLEPLAIFLTHEHYDHCCGVNELISKYNIPIICSKVCGINIGNKRKNLSFYNDGIGFEIKSNIKIVEDASTLDFIGESFRIIYTEGHTPGGICIILSEKVIFTGDTYMPEFKTPKTPGTDKEKLVISQERIKKMIDQNEYRVCSGHGE